MKLQEKDIYLDTLSREDCKALWNDFEYDFANPTEELNLGHSDEKANDWFDEIQKLQGSRHIRLGIFKKGGTVIGETDAPQSAARHRNIFLKLKANPDGPYSVPWRTDLTWTPGNGKGERTVVQRVLFRYRP